MSLKLLAGEFYGGTVAATDVAGFRLTEKIYRQGLYTPLHAHELAHFCFVLAGAYTEKLSGKSAERSPATLLFYPPDVNHAEKHYMMGRHFLIEIDQSRLEGWESPSPDQPCHCWNHRDGSLSGCTKSSGKMTTSLASRSKECCWSSLRPRLA